MKKVQLLLVILILATISSTLATKRKIVYTYQEWSNVSIDWNLALQGEKSYYNNFEKPRGEMRFKLSSMVEGKIGILTGTPPPPTGNWTINDTTIVENSKIIVNGSIIVQTAGTLILKNVTIRMNLTSDGEHWIDSYGNLTVRFSNITAYNTSNNYFIRAHSGSKLLIEDSEISYAGLTWIGNGNMSGLWVNTNDALIRNNYIHDNYVGLYLAHSNYSTVIGNFITNSVLDGMDINWSSHNTIVGNNVTKNEDGIEIGFLGNNNVTGNVIINNTGYGIVLNIADNNTVAENKIIKSDLQGMHIYTADNNIIIDNYLSNNSVFGIWLENSDNNTVVGCTIINGPGIIVFDNSENNYIYLNNIEAPVLSETGNYFDNGFFGNFYSNYTGVDEEGDLIGDTPYEIFPNTLGRYPLILPIRKYSTGLYYLMGNWTTSKNYLYFKVKVLEVTNTYSVFIWCKKGNITYMLETVHDTMTDTYYTIVPESTLDEVKPILNVIDSPPSIDSVVWTPVIPIKGEALTIMAQVSDDKGVTSVILSYYDGTWHNVSMMYNDSLDLYVASIPGYPKGFSVLFKVFVIDSSGNVSLSSVFIVTFVSSSKSASASIGGDVLYLGAVASVSAASALGLAYFVSRRKK